MDFYKRVEAVCKNIPYGRAATYGQIALLCGKPGNARQVGYALNHRVSGPDIPAHRVVNARGFLSGSRAFATPLLQEQLLKAEGIKADSEGYVDLKKYGWHNSMDEALRLEAYFHIQGI